MGVSGQYVAVCWADLRDRLAQVLRSTDAANEGEEYSVPIPAGAFIVNATDHISTKTNHFAPILSDDGLVVCPQKLTGFTGPSANHVTHAYYSGTLAGSWERLPRVSFEPRDKARVGIVRPPIQYRRHFLGRISPIFSSNFPVVCAFSPSRRGGSDKPQAGIHGKRAGKRWVIFYAKTKIAAHKRVEGCARSRRR